MAKSKVAKTVAGFIVSLDLAINLRANSLQIAQGVTEESEPTPVVIQTQQLVEQCQNQIEAPREPLPAGVETSGHQKEEN